MLRQLKCDTMEHFSCRSTLSVFHAIFKILKILLFVASSGSNFAWRILERRMGFEPTTSTLARSHSTTELPPHKTILYIEYCVLRKIRNTHDARLNTKTCLLTPLWCPHQESATSARSAHLRSQLKQQVIWPAFLCRVIRSC